MEDFYTDIYNGIKQWLARLRSWKKTIAIVSLLLLGIIVMGGLWFKDELKSLIKQQIVTVDCAANHIGIDMIFSLNDTISGFNGINCSSGSKITLQVNLSNNSYYTFVGQDSEGPYVLRGYNRAKYYSDASEIKESFRLDNNLGEEIYYCVARTCPFEPKDIIEKIKDMEKRIDNKGQGEDNFLIPLDSTFVQSYLQLMHVE